MAVVDVENVDAFKKIIADSPGGVVAHFWASWAPQCLQMNSVMVELARLNPAIKFIKVEAENLPELSLQYQISAVPTFILFKSGQSADRLDGANAPDLTKKIQHLNSAVIIPEEFPPKQNLNERLKFLINSAPCMLFMKGTSSEPKCGFSKQIIEILNSRNVVFKSFNILADEEVRQGLKTYSNWPTYPQLYVNGELVGGVDIVKEMAVNGELEKLFPKKEKLEDRLKVLVNKAPVMLFMKGNAKMPRCGFSKQIIEIMNDTSISYETFDILEDEEVRQGLKEYSKWPTYPQLYVKGTLIGGLDIIKELQENGDLKSTLQG